MTIIFDKATYKPNENISGRASAPGKLIIRKFATEISAHQIAEEFEIDSLPEGSYSVELNVGNQSYFSAIEVITNPWQRIRYGFLSEFGNHINTAKQVEWAKRLHLTSIQFYDWAYKHEFLMAPDESYADPLGGMISKQKLKELIAGYEAAGIFPSGYAAVYAVDREGWQRWKDSGVYGDDGKPFQLGEDFLWVIDPADKKWLPHFIDQLKAARDFGFKTFHLDQYGWPKRAVKSDGTVVDIAEQFTKMLKAITEQVNGAQFIFNNVNDFPTWATAKTAQDATYIEVWDPNSEYKDLAQLVDKARSYDPNKPIILSAYLKPFANEDIAGANAALELSLSVISSRGASHLITGGDGKVLYDPYYVRNHQAGESTLNILENYHNFIAAAGDLLFDSSRVDITRTHAFGVNTEISIESKDSISPNFVNKGLTAAVFDGDSGLTIHIHNFLDQENMEWDAAKKPIRSSSNVKVSILSAGYKNSWHIGRADTSSKFSSETATQNGDKLVLDVAITGAWTVIHVPKK
jgi:dextranase